MHSMRRWACCEHCHPQSLSWGGTPSSRLGKWHPYCFASGFSAELSSRPPAQREVVQRGFFQGSCMRPYSSCGMSAAVRQLLVPGCSWRCMQSSPALPTRQQRTITSFQCATCWCRAISGAACCCPCPYCRAPPPGDGMRMLWQHAEEYPRHPCKISLHRSKAQSAGAVKDRQWLELD